MQCANCRRPPTKFIVWQRSMQPQASAVRGSTTARKPVICRLKSMRPVGAHALQCRLSTITKYAVRALVLMNIVFQRHSLTDKQTDRQTNRQTTTIHVTYFYSAARS